MKYAIITGGTSGIGLGVAKMLVSKDYYVFATHTSSTIDFEIPNFEPIIVDQTNRGDIYRFIEYIKNKTTHIDCLVCNAGISISYHQKGLHRLY